MAIKSVLRMGAISLIEPSVEVDEFNTPALDQLLIDMWDTMAAESGAGIAAPQIGVNLRVVIFGFEDNSRYPDAPGIPQTVLINPVITPLDEEMDEGWEGCLSVPGMRGLVPRYTKIQYSGFDQFGNSIEREVDGFHARVVQHECDHLDGILYPQRIEDMFYFGFSEELEANNFMESQPDDD
ncbi:MAG: peptide deformylase [Gammaproteobacteria bacterium]|jgi:peptide deformylase